VNNGWLGIRAKARIVKLCRKGLHDLDDPAVSRQRPDGRRRCKPCSTVSKRAYAAAHPEIARAAHAYQQAWRVANPEVALDISREWRATHPEEARAYYRTNHARRKRRDPNADLTAKQWKVLQEVWRGRCAYCGKALQLGETDQEHVNPNLNGGSLTLSNIVPACKTCNSAKGTKIVEQWLSQGRAQTFRSRHAKRLAQAEVILNRTP